MSVTDTGARSNGQLPISLNLRVRGMQHSATIAVAELCRRRQDAGEAVYALGLGQSPFPVPPSIVAELRANAHEKAYLPVRGLPALRAAIAGHLKRVYDIDAAADGVLVGPGSKELMFLVQLVYYGDIVLPTPCWVSYEPQARIIGRQVHRLATTRANDWKLTPVQLAAFCRPDPTRPRLVILNYPSNPGGGTYGEGELRALAETARHYGVILLSDEIYGKLEFNGRHRSIARYYPEGTIVSGGLSKWCGAGGWRLGFFHLPPQLCWLRDAIAAAASETFTSTSAPIQFAAVKAFNGGPDIDAYVRRTRRILAGLGPRLAAILRQCGAEINDPQGGFYLFPDFSPRREALAKRGIATSPALTTRLLEDTGVAVLPGSDFGRAADELTLRLAYVNFDGEKALAGAGSGSEPLEDDFYREHCAETLEAMERIRDWMNRT